LGTPPALILSQDQTRHHWWSEKARRHRDGSNPKKSQVTHHTSVGQVHATGDKKSRVKLSPLDALRVVRRFASRRGETDVVLDDRRGLYHIAKTLSRLFDISLRLFFPLEKCCRETSSRTTGGSIARSNNLSNNDAA
ncbi:MAG TPA: hypothetical protein VGD69_02995, partial [Herpetosiphonaceae bacterium]